eukprot:GFUD01041841.1.p1 GENE.GFUD01041841.1~~GFUD01041841.1.p1  ORF type:complete len:444 (-),score=94.28 GFUD01041841.1:82-1338(-)
MTTSFEGLFMETEADETKNRKFEDKETLLADVSKAYTGCLYSDITFILKDNVSVSTSRFMLACRVPYFATLLYGGFGDNSTGNPVTLDCCDSQIFKQILNFVWEGEISFSELEIQSLLDLLETARFLCIDRLVEGIIDYLEFLLKRKLIEFDDCLVVFDFVILNKFTKASGALLSFIDQNLRTISFLPKFADLSEASIQMLLHFEERLSSEIDLFTAFVNWIKNKETVSEEVKTEMLGCFNLGQFDRKDLIDKVRKTRFFDDKEVCDVLEAHIEKLQDEVKSKEKQNKEQGERLKEQSRRIEETKAGIVLTTSLQPTTAATFDYCCSLDQTHFVNKIEFTLEDLQYLNSYCVHVWNGVNWIKIIDCRELIHTGKQILHFERMKIHLLGVKVTGSKHVLDGSPCFYTPASISSFSASLI